ncbi:hypothetical protein GCM10010992_06200 [Cloacibacterium rupense]|uniref:DUF4153 domain-containing protein n=1 Tax=Cloacibacterium rupense TaxID=517423 RepID=A0ABQ2NH46_9FLAO|nr:DUF4153 domain-containing protein [Cloacibacterium rupense]GGP02314.1 hypothetical protein GCM10010992_06200 [Cloacibacterium rupense]
MKSKLQEILSKAGSVFQNYAYVLLMALLAAITMTLLIESDSLKEESLNVYTRVIIVSLLGISLLFSLTILAERIGKTTILSLFGIGFLVVFYQFFLPHHNSGFTDVHRVLIAVSFILSHLLVSFIGFLGKNNEKSFWQFNKNLFVNVVLTGIFTAVLVGGIMLAITAVDQLFDLELDQKIYPKTFFFLAIFGSCFIFLLFNEDGIKFLEKDGNYPDILKFFVQFILIPLLIIYAVILYFYGGKILIKWDLPRGWVSYLILAYSLVGILALLLVFPLKEISTKSWVKGFSKIFYFALLPLLVLLFVAIFTRILEYGFTENRYYVLLLAIWLTLIVLYFSFWKHPNIKFIPISLFIFGLFSLVFPYFNTFSVSKNSQKKELEEILVKNNLLENGKINFNKRINNSDANEISEKFNFLRERNEINYLKKYFNEKELKNISFFNQRKMRFQIKDEFKNIKYNNEIKKGEKYTRVSIMTEEFSYDVRDYEQIFKVYNYDNQDFGFDGNTFSLKGFNGNLTLYYNNKDIDLSPDILKIVKEHQNKEGEIIVPKISFTKTVGNYELKFLIEQIDYNRYAGKRGTYFINNDILVLIKKK